MTIIDSVRRIPVIRAHYDKKLYLHNHACNLNIESIVNCGRKYFEDETLTALQQKAVTARASLDDIIADVKNNPLPSKAAMNKVIWMFWDKGIESAPDVVKLSYTSWIAQNPDYEVRLLDNNSIKAIADFESIFNIASLNLGLAQKTDYIRVYLLAKYGGVWADSTTFCWTPLNDWLPQAMSDSGFFIFRQPPSRPDRQVASWFLASQPGNPVLVNLFMQLSDFIFKKRCINLEMIKYKYYAHYPEVSHDGTGLALMERLERVHGFPYHLIHYLFNEAVKEPEAKTLWESLAGKANAFVGSNGPCKDVLVSKQSYKGKYPVSETYKSREEKLRRVIGVQ